MPEETQSRMIFQTVAYAASVTPDPSAYDAFQVTLTGAITVANPAVTKAGMQLLMEFVQDATGGRVVTFDTLYKVTWTPTTTTGLRNVIRFYCDGTNWIQTASAIGLPA